MNAVRLTCLYLLIAVGIPATALAEDVPPVYGMQFSPDGKLLAAITSSSSPPGPLVLWNVDDWSIAKTVVLRRGGLDLDFSPNGDNIAYCTKKGVVGILDVATGEMIREFGANDERLNCVAFTPDGKTLVTAGEDTSIYLWNAKTGEQVGKFAGQSGKIHSLSVSPDGRSLLSVDEDRRVILWDLSTQKTRQTFEPSELHVRGGLFSSDGEFILTSQNDGTTRIRKPSTGELRARLRPGSYSANITSDNHLVATSSYGNEVHIFAVDLEDPSPEVRETLDDLLSRFLDENYEVRQHAAQEIVAMGMIAVPLLREAMHSEDAEIRVRARSLREQLLSPEPIAELTGHKKTVQVVDFSPDGKLLATGDWEGKIKVWDTTTFQEVVNLELPFPKGER
ncbi:WD40 repeat domain-containing protein [Bythopirellula goksoeyrii]|uniref:Translocation protein TolB n=1 Tax=Bythopirellula goksoeyrii TaxID=1400387 RepID=A0A5B9Q7Q6_9BACT|nr:PQQ-binding-like beta-propeller repeat protein [Bythopirellula goksoeyrii]QEG33605.1 translocation protein TolB [Bythopirellula goksoeyrii]